MSEVCTFDLLLEGLRMPQNLGLPTTRLSMGGSPTFKNSNLEVWNG